MLRRLRRGDASSGGSSVTAQAGLFGSHSGPPGFICWHRDSPEYNLVAGVSLGAPGRMRLRPFPHRSGVPVLSLELAPRSAYQLCGEVRWRWQHSVPPTKALRYSITFRTLAE